MRASLADRAWATLHTLRRGYDWRSLVVLTLLLVAYTVIGFVWRQYLDLSRGDWLLTGIWIFMTALGCWGISPSRELLRAAIGLGGGLYIEAWGTVTNIWWYFTAERPPLWILPAWPVAAIAVDRLSRALDAVMPEADWRFLWWGTLPPFVVVMTLFIAPYLHEPLTILSLCAMIGVLIIPGDTRQDVTLMLAGSGLGIFLEYWGTSRHCWNYYTGEIPPIAAVLAHGFASVSFQRVATVLQHLYGLLFGASGTTFVRSDGA